MSSPSLTRPHLIYYTRRWSTKVHRWAGYSYKTMRRRAFLNLSAMRVHRLAGITFIDPDPTPRKRSKKWLI